MLTYLIIGASHGIGHRAAQLLEADGHAVIHFSRSKPDTQIGTHHTLDILSDDCPEIDGAIHGLLYSPGSINLKPFNRLKASDFHEDMDINYHGAVKVLHAYESNLREGNGSVVLFSTVAVGTGMPFHSSIAGAKGAVEGLTRTLAAEWAPHIRVNAIAPSITDTPLSSKLLRTEKSRDASAQRHPLKTVGSVDDMAEMATYLLSRKSAFITGQVIGVDGGLSTLFTN